MSFWNLSQVPNISLCFSEPQQPLSAMKLVAQNGKKDVASILT